MINLLAETNQTQEVFIAFFACMVLVGFILIFVDKRRWVAHTERSAYMMSVRSRKAAAEPQEGEEASLENEKKSKEKKKKNKHDPAEYQYEGRIKVPAFLIVGILFGAVGELLGMIFCRHKWYNKGYAWGIPLLAILNVIIGALLLYLAGETGSDDAIMVTAARIVGSGLCW